jgi:hypothetical protein
MNAVSIPVMANEQRCNPATLTPETQATMKNKLTDDDCSV